MWDSILALAANTSVMSGIGTGMLRLEDREDRDDLDE
jgi:hypothetical protein